MEEVAPSQKQAGDTSVLNAITLKISAGQPITNIQYTQIINAWRKSQEARKPFYFTVVSEDPNVSLSKIESNLEAGLKMRGMTKTEISKSFVHFILSSTEQDHQGVAIFAIVNSVSRPEVDF